MTGSPSLRASSTARCSFLVSTIHTAEGTLPMSRMPPRVFSSLSFSRLRMRSSFFVRPEPATSSKSISSSSLRRVRRLEIVLKLVSMPPSQRWLTYGMPTRVACSAMGSCACFLVPTNRMEPPWATVSLTNSNALLMYVSDCCRSMM